MNVAKLRAIVLAYLKRRLHIQSPSRMFLDE